jgi:hypothetical protein
MSEEEKKSFTVKDRRRFDASGNRRGDEGDEENEPPPRAQAEVRPPAPPRRDPPRSPPPPSPGVPGRQSRPSAGPGPESIGSGPEEDDSYPGGQGGVGFAELVLSIATNALIHLGEDTKDGRVPPRVNLPLAAQHIDMIFMLAQKTRGNLTREEQDLIESVLYDLRMKYVAVAQQHGLPR